MKRRKADVASTNYGTVIELQGLSERGHEFMAQLNAEDWQRCRGGAAIAIEPRYAIDIMHAMLDSGLSIRDSRTGNVAHRA